MDYHAGRDAACATPNINIFPAILCIIGLNYCRVSAVDNSEFPVQCGWILRDDSGERTAEKVWDKDHGDRCGLSGAMHGGLQRFSATSNSLICAIGWPTCASTNARRTLANARCSIDNART
jgi:hypothetical protein